LQAQIVFVQDYPFRVSNRRGGGAKLACSSEDNAMFPPLPSMSGSQERDLIIKRGYLTGKGGFLVSHLRSLLCCALLASSSEADLIAPT